MTLAYRDGPSHPPSWGLLILVFVLSLPLVTPRIHASDEIQYFAYLRSVWFDRDVSFENEYRHFHAAGIGRAYGFHEAFLERTTETGRRINFGTIGSALLWAPWYGVADVAVRGARAMGLPAPAADGYSWPYVAAVCYASAFYGFFAVLVSLLAARRLVGPMTRSAEVGAGLAVWWGTPLAFYMYLSPVMAHATSAFVTALFVLVWLSVRRDWAPKGVAVLAVVAALMVMVREQDAFYLPAVAADFAWALAARLRGRAGGMRHALRMAAGAIVGIAAGALAFAPQALAYLALNGYVGPSRLVARKMSWHAPHALGVLASPGHGLLLWTPVVILAAAGALLIARRPRPWPWEDPSSLTPPEGLPAGVVLAGFFLSHVYVAGSVESWTAAGAFGQRRFVSVTVVLVCWLAALLAWASRTALRQRAAALLVAVCVYWNLALMVQFGAGLMDRQRLNVAAQARTAFVTLPRALPAMLHRFLTDRSSFYKSATER